jgi:hypothetical protein
MTMHPPPNNDDSREEATAADYFERAKRHHMVPRYLSLATIYYEGYGLESYKDKPIVGGFDSCEYLFKFNWRKKHTFGQKKQFLRMKRIIQGLHRKAEIEGSDVMEVVDGLASFYEVDCKKSMSKLEDWMIQEGLVKKVESKSIQSYLVISNYCTIDR